MIPFLRFFFQNRVGNNFFSVEFSAFNNAKIFSEILFHRCKVHFVEAKEIRSFGIFPRLDHKLQEIACHKFRRTACTANVSNKFGAVVPIGFHLNHLEILGFLRLILFTIAVPTSPRQFTDDSALSRTGDSGKKKEWLGTDGGEVGAVFEID